MALAVLGFGYHFLAIIALILLLLTAGLLGFAASNLTTTNNATSNATIVANNKTAQSFFYGGMVAAIITFIMLLVFYIITVVGVYRVDETKLITIELVNAAQFSYWYYVILVIIGLFGFITAALAIVGVSYVDASNSNSGGSTARSYGIAAIFSAFISAILIFIMIWPIYSFNRSLVIFAGQQGAVGVVPVNKEEGVFNIANNPNSNKIFSGTIKISGKVTGAPVYANVNGVLVASNVASTGEEKYNEEYTFVNNKIVAPQKQILPEQNVNLQNARLDQLKRDRQRQMLNESKQATKLGGMGMLQ